MSRNKLDCSVCKAISCVRTEPVPHEPQIRHCRHPDEQPYTHDLATGHMVLLSEQQPVEWWIVPKNSTILVFFQPSMWGTTLGWTNLTEFFPSFFLDFFQWMSLHGQEDGYCQASNFPNLQLIGMEWQGSEGELKDWVDLWSKVGYMTNEGALVPRRTSVFLAFLQKE